MVATARTIKQEHPNAKVVFIGPCTAKKMEIKRPNLEGMDYCLTTHEVALMLKELNILKSDDMYCLLLIIFDKLYYSY